MSQGPVLFAYDGSDHARAAIERAGTVLQHGPAVVATAWTSFEDASLQVGTITFAHRGVVIFFNWDDAPRRQSLTLPRPSMVTDFWTGESLARPQGTMTVDLPARSARILILT